ncbi:MAG: major facilitator superfamily 1 [Thermoleophilia bacterium]|nr:major facilitator superfamily 1 [Thermoleophilia bacterium]
MKRSWVILAAVAFANFVFAALSFGLASAGPVIRDQLGVGEAMLGVILAACPTGLMLGTLAWGELADRLDERRVLAAAFAGFGGCTALAAWSLWTEGGTLALCAALFAAGVFGSAAHSAGGRAISAAFAPERHGTVLAIRHTVIPIGGAVGGLLIPALGRAAGLWAPVAWLAGAGVVAAAIVFVALPGARAGGQPGAAPLLVGAPSPLRVRELWLLSLGCAGIAFVQLGVGSFLTVQLVDEAGLTIAAAASVYAVAQLVGAASRIVLGVASDRLGRRAALLRSVATSVAVLVVLALVVPSERVEGALLVATFVGATCWNGVAVAAAATFAPSGRIGATLGMLTTFNAASCAVAPLVLGSVLDHSGWRSFESALLAALALSVLCFTPLVGRRAASTRTSDDRRPATTP